MAAPQLLRANVWELGDDWADPILWYARGVRALKSRPLTEPTGWRFYAAIHGFNQQLWTQHGYLSPSDALPSAADRRTYWAQCQHGSWYFLPWHRGYLLGFEATVRAAIVALGGPAAWTLPYWNYFKPGQAALPPAFASPDWPDGRGDNPLFERFRFGPGGDGTVVVPVDQLNLDALDDDEFTGAVDGGGTGFGGIDTGFAHGGPVHGGIETQPHDFVHSFVGGTDPSTGVDGLMSRPDIAGLDPVFWIHHANIDRLWEVWRRDPAPPAHLDPTDPNWTDGPARTGQRAFVVPTPTGPRQYTPGEMSDLAALGYGYDDVVNAGAGPVRTRVQRLARAVRAREGATMARSVELVGANEGALPVVGDDARATVRLDPGGRERVATGMAQLSALAEDPSPAEPVGTDRVFLNLENVRGDADATTFTVYVGLPPDAPADDHPERRAGSIGLFGVSKASRPDDEHAGNGLTFVLDITRAVHGLHLDGALDVDDLEVRLLPTNPVPEGAQVSIGRVSVFRQSVR